MEYLLPEMQNIYIIFRFFKPGKIIEIGSGFSTLMEKKAIFENKKEDDKYFCDLYCIEPYENEWLARC